MRIEWANYLKIQDVKESNRLKKMKSQNISYVIKELSLGGIISVELYNSLITLKGIRNSLYHTGKEVQKNEEIKRHQISLRWCPVLPPHIIPQEIAILFLL